MADKLITVASAIARLLEQMETEFVFGLNGHGNWGLLDALVYETKIQCIGARAEDQAVELADGYWRYRRGAPLPVVTTSVGPGNANIMPAVATAYYESIGMLVIAGVGPTHWFDRGGMEEAYRNGPENYVGAMRPICKKAVMATRPDTCLELFLRAYKTALTGRPGPVVIAIPYDIQHALIPEESLPDPRPYMCIHRPGADPKGVERAIGLMVKAERPLVVCGSGIANSGAHEALLKFAEATGTPVVATPAGKAAFPESHLLSAGIVGRAGTLHGNHMARNADLVIGIGTHFTDIDTGGWTLFDIPNKTKLIHVDIDENELGRAYPTEVALNADARLALEALTAAAKKAGISEKKAWTTVLGKERDAFNAAVKPLRTSNIAPLHYARVCEDVSQVIETKLPEMAVFFDTGHMLSYGPPFVRAASRHVYHSSFMHRMGWSASAAIGASMASGGKPAVALLGDGAFIMRNTVMLTAVEQKLPVIAVVFDNRSLQIEREAMMKIYGRESLCDYRKKGEKELWGPDFVMMAKSLGCAGVRVEKAEDFKPVFEAAVASGQPTVISVATELSTPQYRSAWYPYPKNWDETWKAGPVGGQETSGFEMPAQFNTANAK